MKPLPPYVFIVPNKDAPEMGAGFVLSTQSPFYIGRVVKLPPNNPFAVLQYRNQYKTLIYSEVEGYSILIVYAGTLEAYKVRVDGPDWEKQIQEIFNQMADFFYREKCLNNQGYYKRYKND